MSYRMNEPLPLSVAIPTYGREAVLVDIIEQLLKQEPAAAELLIVDQTPKHEAETEAYLQRCHEEGAIRWLRLNRPSAPGARGSRSDN